MIEKIMKAIKNSNKKRSRNITIGTVVGFLLSCTAVMGATSDKYLWIEKDKDGKIKFNTTATADDDGKWEEENPYEEITWNPGNKTYTSNMILLSSEANGKNTNGDLSYGLRLSGDLTGVNFVNNGSIKGIMSNDSDTGNSYGYGIYIENTMGNIMNIGIISGSGSGSAGGSGSGYGIYNTAEMGNIINTGIISGIGSSGGGISGIAYLSGSGYGIYNAAEMENIINVGIISGIGNSSRSPGNLSASGYGIYNSGTIGAITNTGVISVSGRANFSLYFGYGIYNSGTIGAITNTGVISVSGSGFNSTCYGIYIDSTIGNIINMGIINGSSSSDDQSSGYGIYIGSTMRNIINTGIISGSGTSGGPRKFAPGYGIANNSGTIGDITNTGIISGSSVTNSYGIYIGEFEPAEMGNIENIGIINGNSSDGECSFGIGNKSSTIGAITNTGIISGDGVRNNDYSYGIYNSGTIRDMTNTGVIYGKGNAIWTYNGTITTASNYGILVNGSDNDVNDGLEIKTSAGENKLVNYGLIIKNGSVIVEVGSTSEGSVDIAIEYDEKGQVIKSRNMAIENETGSDSFTGDKENHILNALRNTYKVGSADDKVTGSIINAYGTAVIFGEADKKLTLSGTIVNGGIDNSAAILGSAEGDTLILQSGKIKYTDGSEATQNTVVNGNIDMGEGADTLTVGDGTVLNGNVAMGTGNDELDIENGAVINGTLDGGEGDDTLNFGVSGAKSNSPDSQGINIMHNISNFEKMNINTNVTLFEKTTEDSKEKELKVTGVESIKIGKDGNLILRIDGTNNNSHALSNNGVLNGTIDSDGGKLLLALNGVSDGSEINIGMKLGNGLYGVENTDIEYRDLFTLETTSLLHSVKKNEQNNTKVTVTTKSTLPLSPTAPEDVNYEKLNKIYQSMRVVDGVKEFNVDSDEKLSTFLGYLNDIYAGNPYSYSSELSRKSVGMFRDITTENQFKPEQNKWLIMGGLTHVDGGTKDTYYGKGYYTYDIGSSDMDADTKITGAYMLGEYGVSDTLTYGVVIGGNKLKSSLSNGSKVDGDALYMGAYAKKYIGNLKVTGGLGLQYGDYDTDRFAAGKGITETRSYSDKYSDMTYDIYLNGRYSNPMGDNFFLEPYGTLSYTYVDQEGADEGSKVLAIETDSKSFDYTAAKVGVDLKKVIPHEKGKSTLSAGVSYTRLLNGADEENITGRFKGGNATDFDILVAHKNEHSIGLNAKYALELESGILFDVKGSYSVERDSHNGSGKNRNKGEWIVGAGIGYKF